MPEATAVAHFDMLHAITRDFCASRVGTVAVEGLALYLWLAACRSVSRLAPVAQWKT